jgi:hypothetical protein
MIIAGLATIFVLAYSKPQIAALGFIALVGFLFVASFVGFLFFRVLISSVYPAVSTTILFGVMLAANLRSAALARPGVGYSTTSSKQLGAPAYDEVSS